MTTYRDAAELLERAERIRDLTLLDRAITELRPLSNGPRDDPVTLALALSALGVGLHLRSRWCGRPADLDEAVAVTRRAVDVCPATDQNHPAVQANLADVLRARFESRGALDDLGEAISVARLASAAATRTQHRIVLLNNLGLSLRVRFQIGGALQDAHEAISVLAEAVELTPADHHQREAPLSNLAGAYQARFEHTGDPGDLDRAIDLGRTAGWLNPGGSPYKAGVQSNLCAALLIRFERLGGAPDLAEAITAGQAAVSATPVGDTELPARLGNLASAYLTRYERTADLADLHTAVELADRTVAATGPTDPARAGRLSNLAVALRTRFEEAGNAEDLERSARVAREAVATCPPGSPALAGHLSNLGASLRADFARTQRLEAADEAADVLRRSALALPADHPDQAVLLSNLGGVLYERHSVTEDDGSLAQAVAAFRRAAAIPTARTRIRVAASAARGQLAAEADDPHGALEGLSLAVELLGRLAPRELSLEDRQQELSRHASVACDAAACALWLGSAARALELLEQGRGLLLSQAMDTRGEIGELYRVDPELARSFDELRYSLDPPEGTASSLDQWDTRRRLAAEFTETVDTIRSIPGFTEFLRPPSAAQLRELAVHGPIVVVNVSELRTDALVVTPEKVRAVPLPLATPSAVRDQAVVLAAAGSAGPALDLEERVAGVLAWLWEAVAEPVLTALALSRPVDSGAAWTRLWWIPTGLLSLLPIHAAQSADGQECVLDRVLSSYAPTLRALGHARVTWGLASPRMLAIAAPKVEGQSALPAARREVEMLRKLKGRPVELIEGSATTRQTVLNALPDYSWTHFALHAESDPTLPSRSALHLGGPEGDLLTVADIVRLNLTNADVAYLSACATARTAPALADEAIQITSAFLLAGYSSVIGTLWPVRDGHALRVARTFYSEVSDGQGLRPDRVPAALHAAAREIRRRMPDRPSVWAVHVHAGA